MGVFGCLMTFSQMRLRYAKGPDMKAMQFCRQLRSETLLLTCLPESDCHSIQFVLLSHDLLAFLLHLAKSKRNYNAL